MLSSRLSDVIPTCNAYRDGIFVLAFVLYSISLSKSTLWQNAQRSSAEYFAAVRDYQVLNTLSDAAENSAAATATWGSAGADPELDVVSGLSKIAETSNSQAGEKISVVVPAKVFFEVNKLTLINNIQRTIKDYLQGSFELEIHAFRPPKDGEGTAYLDVSFNFKKLEIALTAARGAGQEGIYDIVNGETIYTKEAVK